MRKSDKLFRLIKSLSRNEKRYFKLAASIQSGESSYLELFELIEKQTRANNGHSVYDEAKLISQIKDAKLKKNLSVVKNYLYTQILRTLRTYYDEDDVENRLLGWIRDVKFLHSKGLNDEAMTLLYKARKLAMQFQKSPVLLRLYDLENLLIGSSLEPAEVKKRRDDLFANARSVIERELNLLEYRDLESRFFVLNSGKQRIRSEQDNKAYLEIINHPLMDDEELPQSFEAQVLFYTMHSIYREFKEDLIQSLELNRKLRQLHEDHIELALETPARYIASIRNFVLIANIFGDEEEIWKALERLKTIRLKSKALQEKAMFLGIGLELALLSHRGQTCKAIERISEAQEIISHFKIPLDPANELLMHFSFFQPYFRAGQFAEAHDWLFKIVNNTSNPSTRSDLQNAAVYLNLILQYELGNEDVLEHLIPTARRQLKQNEQLHKMEAMVIQTIQNLIEQPKANHSSILKSSLKTVEELVTNPHEAALINYFDFISWLESKIEKRPFAELIAEKYTCQVTQNKEALEVV